MENPMYEKLNLCPEFIYRAWLVHKLREPLGPSLSHLAILKLVVAE